MKQVTGARHKQAYYASSVYLCTGMKTVLHTVCKYNNAGAILGNFQGKNCAYSTHIFTVLSTIQLS